MALVERAKKLGLAVEKERASETLLLNAKCLDREAVLSFKAYVAERAGRRTSKRTKKEVKVLADKMPPATRRQVARVLQDSGVPVEVRFYKTLKETETQRFRSFKLEPVIQMDKVATTLGQSAQHLSQHRSVSNPIAVFVQAELQHLSNRAPQQQRRLPVLDLMLKLDELSTMTSDTPEMSLCEFRKVLQVKRAEQVFATNTDFTHLPFRCRQEGVLPLLTKDGIVSATNEWGLLLKMFVCEESFVWYPILDAAVAYRLDTSAKTFLQCVVTAVSVLKVAVHVSELQILTKKVEGLITTQAAPGATSLLESLHSITTETYTQGALPPSHLLDRLKQHGIVSHELSDLTP